MVGKPNLMTDVANGRSQEPPHVEHALDDERAASMADEGGASGAVMDTAQQRGEKSRLAPFGPTVMWWGAALAGCALLVTALLLRRRS